MSDQPQEDGDVYAEVPEHMREFLREMDNHKPEVYEEGISEMWDSFDAGLCMACGSKLGKYTTLVVNPGGIAAAFCTGVCTVDMNLIGWLQEQHDDLVDRLKFRGGIGDNADGEDQEG